MKFPILSLLIGLSVSFSAQASSTYLCKPKDPQFTDAQWAQRTIKVDSKNVGVYHVDTGALEFQIWVSDFTPTTDSSYKPYLGSDLSGFSAGQADIGLTPWDIVIANDLLSGKADQGLVLIYTETYDVYNCSRD